VIHQNTEYITTIKIVITFFVEPMQNGQTYPQSYGEIVVKINCEIYCKRPVVTVVIRANGYGKITLDA
jgi:hypothetical protein